MNNIKNCIVYYTDSGYIVAITGGWYDEELGSIYSTLEVPFANSNTHYVHNGQLKEKLDWTPIITNNKVSGIPNPSKVYVYGEVVDITDGELHLDKPNAFEVNIVISPVTHITKEIIL